MNKAIFFDLDGTLLNDDYQISDVNLEAITQAQQANFKIYLVTGKAIKHAFKFYEKLHLKTLMISSAGQVISQGEKIIWQKNLDEQKVRNLLNDDTLQSNLQDFIIQTNQTIYTSNINSQVIKLFYEKDVVIKVFNNDLMIENIVGLYCNLKIYNHQKKWEIIKKLHHKWGNWFEFHPWEIMEEVFIVHVMPAKINKWSAIQKIIKHDQIDYLVAFGNGRNDIPMLKKANISFAMKNASEEVKLFSDYVTEFDNNHSGVGQALKQFLQINS